MKRRRHLLLGAAALPFAGTARANNFPNGPFRIIVPFGAGSATDQGGAQRRRGAEPHLRRSRRRREQAGRQRRHRRRGRGQGQAGRPDDLRLLEHRGGLERRHDEVPALRPDQGLRAGDADRPRAGVPDRQSQGRGDDGAGVRGAVPQAAGQDQLRLGQRLDAHLGRAAEGQGRRSTWCTCPTRARPPPCRTRWPATYRCASPIP